MKKYYFGIIIVLMVVTNSCCRRSHATKNATKFVETLKTARSQTYDQVILVKKSSLDDEKKLELKQQYEETRTLFNRAYTNITDKLPDSPGDQLKCPILGYQTLVHDEQSTLDKATEKGNEFLKNSNKALSPSGAGAGFLGILTILKELYDVLQKENLAVCKEKIRELEYKLWEDIR